MFGQILGLKPSFDQLILLPKFILAWSSRCWRKTKVNLVSPFEIQEVPLGNDQKHRLRVMQSCLSRFPTQFWSWGRDLLWAEARHHLIVPESGATQRWSSFFWIGLLGLPDHGFLPFSELRLAESRGQLRNFKILAKGPRIVRRIWDFFRMYSSVDVEKA